MTSTRIRRATRRHRCARCGLEKVYENAGAVEARYWFRRHSCIKREAALLRTALAEQREALIDRTPKPCLHKRADHQHGTNACYILDRCRCLPCAKAHSDQETWRERQKAYGRYNKYVAGELVREHLAELADYGIGLKRVSALSGVSTGSLSKIVFGVYAPGPGGRNGNGDLLREPSRRVLRSTAEKIYAIEPIPANLAAGAPDRIRTPIARLHLRALVALGWSMSKISHRLGITPGNFTGVIGDDARILQRRTVDAIEALYAELSMALPPEGDQRTRIAASRARRYAKDHGWRPPLALDEFGDDAVDEPDEYLDHAAVERRLHGDRVRLTKAEAAEVVRRWVASGRPLAECERTTGIKPDRHYRVKDQERSA